MADALLDWCAKTVKATGKSRLGKRDQRGSAFEV
jgi:hypothetical protein